MTANDEDAKYSAAADRFATTRWSIVRAAGSPQSAGGGEALAALCQTYWYPLYAYVRRQVPDVNEAHDLTQAFFAELLEKNFVGPAAPERGRFRAYLLTSFKHFLSHEWERAKAQKRGGGHAPLSLDFNDGDSRIRLESCAGLSAEELYEKQWAVAMLERVMKLLQSELAADGKADHFVALKGFLVGEHEGTTYDQAAAKLGMTTAAAKMAASRMRSRYRKLLREEIAQTVVGPDEVDEEIRELFRALGN